MSTAIVIPARYYSQRLPQKPLALIAGVSLIQRVYERCLRADVAEVFVATDHEDILNHVHSFGGNCVLTSPSLASGTDRVAVAARSLPDEYRFILNVQGDEPLIEPEVIRSVAKALYESEDVNVSTPIRRIRTADELTNPNVVKVVLSQDRDALYFSRAVVPFDRDRQGDGASIWLEQHSYYKHLGIYGYRRSALERFVELGESTLERIERLEQLRLLEAGIRIRCVEVEHDSVAVDTPDDIHKVESILRSLVT